MKFLADMGAIITVTEGRVRVRNLPLEIGE
jgi:hypothetical protein